MKSMLFAILLPCALMGQEDQDQVAKGCLDKATTTADMLECQGTNGEAWDKALNRAYKTLMNLLDQKQKKALIATQREWIKFRELEFKWIWEVYKDQGTMGLTMGSSATTEVVKSRAIILQQWVQSLEALNNP